MPYLDAETIGNQIRQRLFIDRPERTAVIYAGTNTGTRPILAELIGDVDDPVWCALFTRITPNETKQLINDGVETFQPSEVRILK